MCGQSQTVATVGVAAAAVAAPSVMTKSTTMAIDEMIERVNRFKKEPDFTQDMEKRRLKTPDFTLSDDQILRRMVKLIAYSNNAQSAKVTALFNPDVFKPIFSDYCLQKASELNHENIVNAHWKSITAIRFKYKIESMVDCARCLLKMQEKHGSFMQYLAGVGVPHPINSSLDVVNFWQAFGNIRNDLAELRFPYFSNFTTLCHLLLSLGFDCAKPDSAVMKAAVNLSIIPPAPRQKKNPRKSNNHPERSLKMAVEAIQNFAVQRDIRVPVLDLYFLIHGGQTDAQPLVQDSYYA
jgi:3-methyladenine DNA glycosylase Tag